MTDDEKSKSQALGNICSESLERVEYPGHAGGRDAGARIVNLDSDSGFESAAANQDFSSTACVFDRIVNQIAQYSLEQHRIAHDNGAAVDDVKPKLGILGGASVIMIQAVEQFM